MSTTHDYEMDEEEMSKVRLQAMPDNDLSVLENVTIRWVNYETPDKYGKYSFTCILDPQHVEQLLEQGISNFKEVDGDPAYAFNRNVNKRNGSAAKPIAVFDQDRNRVEGKRISNGTVADVYYTANQWNVNGNSGVKGQVAFISLKESS